MSEETDRYSMAVSASEHGGAAAGGAAGAAFAASGGKGEASLRPAAAPVLHLPFISTKSPSL